MRRLRIAMVSDRALSRLPDEVPDPDGAYARQVQAAGLSAGLAERGHEVDLYPPPESGDPLDLMLQKIWTDPDRVPDVIHAPSGKLGAAALTAGHAIGVPVVLGYTAPVGAGPKFTADLTQDGVVRVVTTCLDDFQALLGHGVPRAAIRILPGGVDAEEFRPASAVGSTGPRKARTGKAERKGRRILGVGPLANGLGFAHLVNAVAHVPETELVIAGQEPADGEPFQDKLRSYAERLGVADRVRFLGPVTHRDLPEMYRGADVLAAAPDHEPNGLIPLQAMASGLPVVAYAVGCLKEVVLNDVTGVLVAPGDVRALGRALRLLLSDEVRRMTYASAAVDRVRSRHTWARLAEEAERIYADAIGVVESADEPDPEDED